MEEVVPSGKCPGYNNFLFKNDSDLAALYFSALWVRGLAGSVLRLWHCLGPMAPEQNKKTLE